MLANTLKSNQSILIIIILFFGTALWGFTLWNPLPISFRPEQEMPFYTFISQILSKNRYLFAFTSFAIAIAQGFLLIGFNKKFILISNRTFLPAFFYIFITGSLVLTQNLSPEVIGGFFLFFAIDFIFRTYRVEYALNEIYLSGFFIALAGFFWVPFLYFLVLLFISLIILRTFSLREWIVALLGFLTPLFFLFVIYFVFLPEHNGIILFNYILAELTHIESFVELDISYIIYFSFLLLLTIIFSIKIIGNYQSKKIKTRKYFEINWWYFLIGVLVFSIFKRASIEIIYIISIPISFLFTEYFYSIRNRTFLNIILLCLYCCSIYIQIKAHL